MSDADPIMLIIEDDVAVARSIADYFEDYEWRVLVTGNGLAGMELFKERQPQVVLVDLKIPGLDGMEVLHRVRELSPETPVLVISATGDMNDVVQALRLGAWDYLVKPIPDLSILRYAVERTRERTRLLTENRLHRERLEEEVQQRTRELGEANRLLEDKNVALREILATIESEKAAMGQRVVSNVEKVVLPMLSTLRPGLAAAQQRKIEEIEASLRDITSPFAEKLTRDAARLSPTELRISALIRRGLSMKEIADMEHIAPDTVATHRRAIRKKLGITNSKVNLATYLETYFRENEGETVEAG